MANILFVFVSLFAGVFCFFITRNLYFSIAVLLLYILFFFLYISPKRAKFKRNISRSYEAINFINNFIISLSVSCSLPKALENAKNSGSLNLKLQIESLSHLDVEKQIEYLYKYFEIPIYGVFINIIQQFVFNGGDILSISQLLIRDSRGIENRLNEFEQKSMRYFKELISSWGLSFLILGAIHISLANLYKEIYDLPSYPLLISVFFVLFLVNYAFLANKIYDIGFISKGDTYAKEVKEKIRKRKFRSKERTKKLSKC